MAGDKYLYRNNTTGKVTENRAIDISTGAPDAGKIVATQSDGTIHPSFLPTGVGPDVKVALTSEAISANDYVNIWNDGGVEKVRLADASVAGREAMGFVKAAFASGVNATVFFEGPNSGFTGLTIGSRQYLSTAGDVTATVPLAPNFHQLIGYAVSATEINTDIDDCIILVS